MTKPDILDDIFKELARAKRKHPNWPDHPAGQAGIVVEEAGELMKACLQKKYERKTRDDADHRRSMRAEAVQVAAMAIRFLENLK
jgi:NTP pyrophosphatase (non-canonical NTP hydrolase)